MYLSVTTRGRGAPRPSCTRDGKSDLHAELQRLAKAAGLDGRVRIKQIRLPGPMRARTDGGGLSRGGLVRNVRLETRAEIVAEHLVADTGGAAAHCGRMLNNRNCRIKGKFWIQERGSRRPAIAFSELLLTETSHSSGFFLKKKPPSMLSKYHLNSENALGLPSSPILSHFFVQRADKRGMEAHHGACPHFVAALLCIVCGPG